MIGKNNNTIWKFEMEIKNFQLVSMPEGAEILSAKAQNEIPTIWALVNPENKKEARSFFIIMTGKEIPRNCAMKYISTIQIMKGLYQYVMHIFEKVS